MLNKMVKLKNKKAFTLIEMMAVVAIVAILVAILVPVIGNSTVKSRAATNAANLRAVEAELATLKVSNPECFVPKSTTSPGAELSYVLKFLYGENAAVKYLDSVTAQNGTLTFTEKLVGTGASVLLDGVPTSVSVKADVGMDVADDAQMIIQLIDNEIVAVYPSADGKVYFDKNCFAEVAETGKFTGTGTDSSDGGVRGWLDETFCSEGILHSWTVSTTNPSEHICSKCSAHYAHDYDSDGVCTKCGATNASHVHVDEKSFDGDVFGFFGPDGECDTCGHKCMHKYKDGVCKYGCGTVCPTCNGEGETGGCSECGLTHKHKWSTTEVSGRYECSVCKKTCGNTGLSDYQHNFTYVDATTHKCKTCGYTTSHDGDTKCDACNATRTKSYNCTCTEYVKSGYTDISKCNNCDGYKKDHNDGHCDCKKHTYGSWTAPTN